MSVVRLKRTFDEINSSPFIAASHCSPHQAHPEYFPSSQHSHSSPNTSSSITRKRSRNSVSPLRNTSSCDVDDNMSPNSPAQNHTVSIISSARERSPFIPLAHDVERFISPPKKSKHTHNIPITSMYTVHEVRKMISDALSQRDTELRNEYDRVLAELLREQFDNFSQFSRDYISRQINKNDLSYLS